MERNYWKHLFFRELTTRAMRLFPFPLTYSTLEGKNIFSADIWTRRARMRIGAVPTSSKLFSALSAFRLPLHQPHLTSLFSVEACTAPLTLAFPPLLSHAVGMDVHSCGTACWSCNAQVRNCLPECLSDSSRWKALFRHKFSLPYQILSPTKAGLVSNSSSFNPCLSPNKI